MKTLIVVDPQYDFMPGGSLAVNEGDAIVPIINQLMPKYDLVVATQDWHPENHGSFASNNEGKEAFEEGKLDGLPQVFWPDHCVQGSEGAQFHRDLDQGPIEAIFRKGMDPVIDSYSGFYDNDHRKATGLAGYLKARSCEELDFCGLAADICVYFTLKDALKEGFAARLLTPATRPLNAEDFAEQKEELQSKGVQLVE